MEQDLFSHRVLDVLCKDGDIEGVHTFLEKTLPSLPQEHQNALCSHLSGPCNELPCTATIVHSSAAAAQEGQAEVFAYLWDTFLAPRGTKAISWPCLRAAAFQGSIPLAQAFWSRDSECFDTTEPRAVHGPVARDSNHQVNIAIRNDRFEYVDFMLAHGADINAGFPRNDLLKMVVRCAVDDETTLRRIRFLVSRGARVAGSGALRAAATGGSIELALCLLDSGSDVDNVADPEETSSLMAAAGEGYEEMVRLLLDCGANTELVNRDDRDAVALAKEKGHESVVRVLQAHRSKIKASKTAV